jgi:hypothetical protein
MEKLKKCVIALSIHSVSETCFSHTVEKQIAGEPEINKHEEL